MTLNNLASGLTPETVASRAARRFGQASPFARVGACFRFALGSRLRPDRGVGRSVARFGILDAPSEREAKIDLMFAALIIPSLLAIALYQIVDLLGKRLNFEK